MNIIFSKFKSFRTQIFFAFILILILIVIWFLFYGYIDKKIDKLNDFNYKTYQTSKDFSVNIKSFQAFQLFGYKDKSFYANGKQNDIDLYIENLEIQKDQIIGISKESQQLKIDIGNSVRKLSKDLDSLITNVKVFKNLALARGFKDDGLEGKIREKDRLLEKDSSIDKVILLELHRLINDYLLRAEDVYIEEFEVLIDKEIEKEKLNQETRMLLIGYKNDINELVRMGSDLGFSQHQGLYGKINYLNDFVEDSFRQIAELTKSKGDNIKSKLLYLQIIFTVVLALLGLVLSLYISKYLTKDIKALTLDISNYIKSNFKASSEKILHSSNIREVDLVLNNYEILKEKLTKNIKFLEEATQKANRNAEFKAQFLANMSHEIRSPLNGVIGMLNMLKTKSLTEEQMEYLETAEYSAEHLLGLVNMILDHSKIEAGKMKLKQYPFNLKKELTKLIRLFEYRVNDKNLKLFFNYDDAISNVILGDNLRLQQVLINLMDNAIKFTDFGFVKLEVSRLKKEDNIQRIRFEVIDSGIGIETEKTEQLLKAFEQADLTATRKFGGTGLGLTITNQLIQLMGGSELKINGLKEGGSCFGFEIPFEINTKASDLTETNTNNVDDEGIIIAKALIVEDNLINQKVLSKLLEKINIPSEIACSGQEAIDMFEKEDYDIIFMDINMPDMDGYETTEHIQASKKYSQNPVPIIAVTASAFEEDRSKAIERGMDDFITKPIVLRKLKEAVIKQLKKQ